MDRHAVYGIRKRPGFRHRRLSSNIGLYRSDLQRTMESADVIGSLLGCTPVPLAEFRGLDNRDAAQLTQLEAAIIQNPEPKSELLDWRPYANA